MPGHAFQFLTVNNNKRKAANEQSGSCTFAVPQQRLEVSSLFILWGFKQLTHSGKGKTRMRPQAVDPGRVVPVLLQGEAGHPAAQGWLLGLEKQSPHSLHVPTAGPQSPARVDRNPARESLPRFSLHGDPVILLPRAEQDPRRAWETIQPGLGRGPHAPRVPARALSLTQWFPDLGTRFATSWSCRAHSLTARLYWISDEEQRRGIWTER